MSIIRKERFIGGKLMEQVKSIIEEIVKNEEEKQRLKLRLGELIKHHEQELLSLEQEDRKWARLREVETLKAGSRNLTQNILAYAAITAFFFMTGFVLAHGLGKMDKEASFIIGNLTGMAAAITKDIYGYYFGSSKGEADARIKTRQR
jgi:hypothetical protein